MLYVICYFRYMLFFYLVCRLLSRCCLASHKNSAALKLFGACDNKHFDFDFDFNSIIVCLTP